jgi:gliding motility-associated-like protein
MMGYMVPRTGKGYAGIYLFVNTGHFDTLPSREYLQVKLIQPLVAGRQYQFTLFAALAGIGFPTDRLAIHFAKEQVYVDDFVLLPLNPHIQNAGKFITARDNWTEFKGSYTAAGGEQYLIIGNFDSDENTPVLVDRIYGARSYYYIDDVSLYECDNLVDLGSDTTICAGETLQLDAATEGATYSWQDGSSLATYTVSREGLYWVDVYTDGCHTRDSVYVSVKAPRFSLGEDLTLCRGQSVTLRAPIAAKPPYRWSDGSQSAAVTITKTGAYWLTATINGCTSTDTVQITFEEPFQVFLGTDTALCHGEVLRLSAFFPEATYVWNDQTTASGIDVWESGVYSVQVRQRACESEGTINVTFFDCPEDIPNVITPNQDNKNDTFFIKEIRNDQWAIEIVNRWGEPVYRNGNYRNDWDASGRPVGIYYYRLENTASRRQYTGWIQVLR